MLLAIRIPLVVAVNFIYADVPAVVVNFFNILFYILLFVCITQVKAFHIYNIDQPALFLLCASLAFLLLESVGTHRFWLLLPMVFLVSFSIRSQMNRAKRLNSEIAKWMLVGAISGFTMPFVLLFIASGTFVNPLLLFKPSVFFLFVFTAFAQMSNASVVEEFLFRGLLWGHLRTKGLDEKRVFLVQALLFWLAHLYYVSKSFTFLLTIPLLSILLGYVTYRSKSISPALIMHAFFNAVASGVIG